jgi:hypothetical protein
VRPPTPSWYNYSLRPMLERLHTVLINARRSEYVRSRTKIRHSAVDRRMERQGSRRTRHADRVPRNSVPSLGALHLSDAWRHRWCNGQPRGREGPVSLSGRPCPAWQSESLVSSPAGGAGRVIAVDVRGVRFAYRVGHGSVRNIEEGRDAHRNGLPRR